uniref:Uncharacterized protein n=1 Tax=Schistosoma mansoni TaxID=6183 RepID=A0A5K4F4M1_SCHMA
MIYYLDKKNTLNRAISLPYSNSFYDWIDASEQTFFKVDYPPIIVKNNFLLKNSNKPCLLYTSYYLTLLTVLS